MSQYVFNDGLKRTNVYLKNVKTEAVYALFDLFDCVFFPTSGSDI